MIYLVGIITAFTALQVFSVLINFLFQQQKYRQIDSKNEDLISILIPARNEEENLENTLQQLSHLTYQNLEIIVFDDQSEDRTPDIIRAFSNKDKRIHMMHSGGLPEGWLGKNYACYQMASQAKGKYLLFLDADVTIKGTILEDSVARMKKQHVSLLSVFPLQVMKSIGEWVTVPLMNYILLTLLPLVFVRISPFVSHAAANGQFMFFDAAKYKSLNPHFAHKISPVEDINIARYYKQKKERVTCMVSDGNVLCRMYKGYQEALNGFTKNILMFFGNSPLLALAFWILTTLGFLVLCFYNTQLLLLYGIIAIMLRLLVSDISRQNAVLNILLIPVHQFIMLIMIIKAMIVRYFKTNYQWKGRSVIS